MKLQKHKKETYIAVILFKIFILEFSTFFMMCLEIRSLKVSAKHFMGGVYVIILAKILRLIK